MKRKKLYRFYKNKRTRFHPSLQIESNDKRWKNMELTSSPTTSGRYIKLKHNPNGSDKQAYIRKYLRNDSIKTRGELLAKYHLSEDDLKEIELFIRNNKKSQCKAYYNWALSARPRATNKNIKTQIFLPFNHNAKLIS